MHREEEKRKKRRAAKYSRFHQPEGHKVYQWGESNKIGIEKHHQSGQRKRENPNRNENVRCR